MQSIIIGLGHRARQGKDTAAKFIMQEFGSHYDIRRYALADELKLEVLGREHDLCSEHGIPWDYNPDKTDPLCSGWAGKQGRLLQFWGQKRRQEDAFYWIHKLRDRIALENPQFALVCDVRYRNEAFWIRNNNGLYVKVQRPGYLAPDRDPNHISEVDLDNFTPDVHICAGSLPALRTEVLRFFVDLLQMLESTTTTESFTRETLDAEVANCS